MGGGAARGGGGSDEENLSRLLIDIAEDRGDV